VPVALTCKNQLVMLLSKFVLSVQVAAGSFSNLYRGYYCGQEVAVKILKEYAG